MGEHKVFWGDFHTHLEDMERGDDILRAGADNIDFTAVLAYPFRWEYFNRLKVETVRNRPEFLENWKTHQRLCREHNAPGRFTTFLGYEWHGDRTRWGDHNVIYFDHDQPLDDAWDVADLFAHLRERRAFAIPHHTAYKVEHRGKDWNVHDPALCPVMEVYSGHGSSEACDAPEALFRNRSMGPATSGGSWQDALARGIRIGVIGSNDGAGLPGRYWRGRAAVLAMENTREALWEAIAARRTYAVTGDRVLLDVRIEGRPMGSEIRAGESVDVEVTARGTDAVDRIELFHNNVVAGLYGHAGRWERDALAADRAKVRMELGWGPHERYGGTPAPRRWQGTLRVEGGRIADVEKCITQFGQKVDVREDACTFDLTSNARTDDHVWGLTESLVFEIAGDRDTRLTWDIEGTTIEATLGDHLQRTILEPLYADSWARIGREHGGLGPPDFENPDTAHHMSHKIKLHRAAPFASYDVAHTFRGVTLLPGANWLYVRLTQRNGQMAWSSPVWAEV